MNANSLSARDGLDHTCEELINHVLVVYKLLLLLKATPLFSIRTAISPLSSIHLTGNRSSMSKSIHFLHVVGRNMRGHSYARDVVS